MDARSRLWLTLAARPKLTPYKVKRLMERLSLEDIAEAAQDHPEHIGLAPCPRSWMHFIDQALTWLEAQSNRAIITPEHPAYPPLLQQISDPPLVLFVEGCLDALSQTCIAMVGSRACTPGGRQAAYQLGQQLSDSGVIVVSGMALGIDTQAHLGALAGASKTCAVLGTGLKHIYPKRNQLLAHRIMQQGCLISELFPETAPLAYHFPRRNRIISGMSLGVIVIEAALKSGSLITTRHALEQNREVFAVPGSIHNIHSEGCHHLIQQGAKLVLKVEDILNELNLKGVHATLTEKLLPIEQKEPALLTHIGYEVTPIDRILEESGLLLEQLLEPLLALELEGWIVAVSGGYTRIRRC